MAEFVEKHSGELTILILVALVLGTLLVLVPQLLRAKQRWQELQHAERMAALEKGQTLPHIDDRARTAARTASLVPMVVICAAATVTCFLSAFRSDSVFAATLAVWSVAGVVSVAAIQGGVWLMGRLVHNPSDSDPDDVPTESEAVPERPANDKR